MADKIIAFCYVMALGLASIELFYRAIPVTFLPKRRIQVLFGVVNLAFFLSPSYLIFWVITCAAVLSVTPRENMARMSVFFFLLPILPELHYQPSVAGVPLLQLGWSRVLTVLLLLPLLPGALRSKPLLHFPVDKYVIAFFILFAAFDFRDASLTAGLRGSLTSFVDILIPYFVLTRQLKTEDDIRNVLIAFALAMCFLGLINLLEMLRYWHIYAGPAAELTGQFTPYAGSSRAGFLRAFGPLDKPSASAFYFAASLGVLWVISSRGKARIPMLAVLGVLGAGLVATFSRGSWVAAAIVGAGFIYTYQSPRQWLGYAVFGAIAGIPVLFYTEFGNEILDILPFIGDQQSQAAATISYRQRLLEAGLRVAGENPLFGSKDVISHPALQELAIGSGFIDIVNQYLVVLLYYGYVGLYLYLSIFGSTVLMLWRSTRKKFEEGGVLLGRGLAWSLFGLAIALISTTAGGRVGVLLWCLIAVSAAYCGTKMEQRTNHSNRVRASGLANS